MNYFSYIYKNIDKIICTIVAIFALISILIIGSNTVDTNYYSRSVIVQKAAKFIAIFLIVFTLR